MATLLKCGGLFLHVPKTGGNWVSDVLEANELVFAHVGAKHARRADLAALDALLDEPRVYDRGNRPLFAFCFVRHPLRWYESWYRMGEALGWPAWGAFDAAHPAAPLDGLGAPSFHRFIENVLREQPGFLTALFDSYAAGAHFIGRQERMAAELLDVLRVLHVTADADRLRRAPRVNVGTPADVTLDASLRDALYAAEAGAFERYGYDEDGLRALHVPCAPFPGACARQPLTPPFASDTGRAWRGAAPALTRFADDLHHPAQSLVRVLEDGRPLGPGHVEHAEVRRAGGGRFSHWCDTIVFSTSDDTDPNLNGRRYELTWDFPAPPGATTLLATAPALTPERLQ